MVIIIEPEPDYIKILQFVKMVAVELLPDSLHNK